MQRTDLANLSRQASFASSIIYDEFCSSNWGWRISIFRTVMTNYPCSYHCSGLVNCRNLFGLACLKWHFYYQLKCAMNTHTHVLSYHKSPLLSFILSSRFKSCNLPFEWLKEMLQIRHLSENLQRCKQNNYVGFLFVCGLSHMFIIRA